MEVAISYNAITLLRRLV